MTFPTLPRGRMARTHHKRGFLSERGQGLVEFALILPMLCLIILAIVQFGVLYNNYETLTAATRDGARKAAVSRTASDPVGAATQAVKDSAYGLDQSQLGITVSPGTPW